MTNNLSGKAAVITGATSGIGLATAREFSGQGMDLVLTGRRQEQLDEICDELNATGVAGDITDPDLPSGLLETAVNMYGRCDVVLNNAGVMEVNSIEETDIEKVCQMARINVEAVYRIAYTFIRHFKEVNSGHLVNISSILGSKTRPNAGAYAGTKYAIEALSESLRMELAGTSVGVSCIQPGLVMTQLHRNWSMHPTESLGISEPLQPEDIARSIIFVLTQPPHVRIPSLMVLPGEQPM